MTIAYLNGKFLPIEQATISPMDRGFLFGDSVYEVIPVYNNKPFRAEQHLTRLANSLAAIQLTTPLDNNNWHKIFAELIQQNGGGHQSIYLQCTRGFSPLRDFPFPNNIKPTIFAYSAPLHSKSVAELSQGISAITVKDIRWLRCDIKSTNLLANVLLRQQAVAQGAQEAILVRDGFAVEGSATNLFVVKKAKLITPVKNNLLLGGITREVVLELAAQQKITFVERAIKEKELSTADEIWLTSSNREIMPVMQLNTKPVGDGQAGPLWRKMIAAYQEFKQKL